MQWATGFFLVSQAVTFAISEPHVIPSRTALPATHTLLYTECIVQTQTYFIVIFVRFSEKCFTPMPRHFLLCGLDSSLSVIKRVTTDCQRPTKKAE